MRNCTGCKGRGFKVHMQQMGPGMISQSQEVCGECEGRGEVIPPSSRSVKINKLDGSLTFSCYLLDLSINLNTTQPNSLKWTI